MTLNPIEQQAMPRWAVLAQPPPSRARAWIAERLFRYAADRLDLAVVFPDGERIGAGGPDAPVLRVLRPQHLFRRLGIDASIGFGESYMAGDWTADDDLADVLTPLAAHVAALVPRPLQALRRWVDATRPPSDDNTPANARANISSHYDLSNDLFGAFLDPSMTYSSAWYGPGDDLYAAQLRKIDGVLDYAGVGAGTRLLEIGTGWGALAVRAAQRGAHVTTLTLSAEQRALAQRRIDEAGVGNRVRVLVRDYRYATGQYDAVVAVEMIEAVGAAYWPVFFATLDRLLVPGGRVGLQAITMPHDRLEAMLRSYTWIQKYIFPGGQLISVQAIEDQVRVHTTLDITGLRSLRPHYARTLAEWRVRFTDQWPVIAGHGFDETFRRLWEFYLAYAEAGFRAGYLDVWQLRLTKPLH